ncbi:MAG: TraV family lipoprotein [Chromatiales bacterium]|nr:TraV family lipoprotein [Chromatiales bacterium]
MIVRKLIAALAMSSLLSGCASAPRYACGLPDGVTCEPVSAVYARSIEGRMGHPDAFDSPPPVSRRDASPPIVATVQPGSPVLAAPRTLRIWVAPWEDADGDLHDETFLYLRLDAGAWTVLE